MKKETWEDKFDELNIFTERLNGMTSVSNNDVAKIKDFIRNEVIPNALWEVCDLEWVAKSRAEFVKVDTIKQRAKEKFGIESYDLFLSSRMGGKRLIT